MDGLTVVSRHRGPSGIWALTLFFLEQVKVIQASGGCVATISNLELKKVNETERRKLDVRTSRKSLSICGSITCR